MPSIKINVELPLLGTVVDALQAKNMNLVDKSLESCSDAINNNKQKLGLYFFGF